MTLSRSRTSVASLVISSALLVACGGGSAKSTLSVSRQGAGNGTVRSDPTGISCGTTCSVAFSQGATVTLTATAAAGSQFSGWSGGCSGSGTCAVKLDKDAAVVATFIATAPTGGVPSAPASATAAAQDGKVALSWTAPTNDGGAAITGYAVTSSAGGAALSFAATELATTVTGLTNGASYTFSVAAKNSFGAGQPAVTNAVVPRGVPGQPTAVHATASKGQAVVAWTAPASNNGAAITKYTAIATPGGATLATTGATTATFTGLTNGTAYTFVVVATNEAGDSAPSAASAAVTPGGAPDAPAITSVTAGIRSATVVFSAPASNGAPITGYTVTVSTGGAYAAATAVITGTSAAVTGLANGATVTFKVSATNSFGTSADSAASTAVTLANLPAKVAGVAAVGTHSTAGISWIRPADGGAALTKYTIDWTGGAGGSLDVADPNATAASVTGLVDGTAYSFTVSAWNAVGKGPASDAAAATPHPLLPGAPAITSAVSNAGGSATITWTAPVSDGGSAITLYTVSAVEGPQTQTAASTLRTATVTGLTNGSPYTFRVFATNGVGVGPASNASTSVTPVDVPAAPARPAASAGIRKATITFARPANNGVPIDGYSLEQDGGAGFVAATLGTVVDAPTVSLEALNLGNGATYSFRARAHSTLGFGPFSASSDPATTAKLPNQVVLSAAFIGDGSVTLRWSDAAAEAAHPIALYTVTQTQPTGAAALTTAGTSLHVTGLTNGTAYRFSVHAQSDVGIGAESAITADLTPTAGSSCGDGFVVAPEECDDGPAGSDACDATCHWRPAVCGDGKLQHGEQCDDGNKTPGDGCENDCTLTLCPGPAPTAPAAGDLCSVSDGSAAADGSKLFTGIVVAPGKVFNGGQVLIGATGTIQCVACNCAAGADAARRITCPDGIITPGLINPHDHITFQGAPPAHATFNERYEHRHDWRTGTPVVNSHTKQPNAGTSNATIKWGELRQIMAGTTSVAGSGGQSGLLRNLDKPNSTGSTGTQEGLDEGVAGLNFQTFPMGDSGGARRTNDCNYPASGIDKPTDIPADAAYLPHVAEGIEQEARNEFLCFSGAQDAAVASLLSPRTAIIHGVGLKAADIQVLASSGTSLIWSPRSNVSLYGDTAQVQIYKRLGANVALGTDWLYSGSMNVLRELRCADSLNSGYFGAPYSDEQLFNMVTSAAADALSVERKVGRLAVGKIGDVAIFRGSRAGTNPYRAVINANPQDVALTMRAGKVLYAEAAVVNGLGAATIANCEAVPAAYAPGCPTNRMVCVKDELNETVAALVAEQPGATPTYGLAYCAGTPPNEPSCVPRRDNSWCTGAACLSPTPYTGLPTPGDRDGDGVPDIDDNCPDVFNPIRPEDCVNGVCKQADADNDGIGDACDPCPLTPGVVCAAPTASPNDLDGDGIPNAIDNCPGDANPDQLDSDGSGKGDVCQPCPAASYNTVTGVCTTDVYAVKSLRPGGASIFLNSKVTLTNLLVTAVVNGGFFAQVHEADGAAYKGADKSGVFYFGSSAAAVGDRVNLTGATVADFNGQVQLTGGTLAFPLHGQSMPAPIAVTAAEVATGGPRAQNLESVLVRLQGSLHVTDIAPTPGPRDGAVGGQGGTNEFVVDTLRVNDLIRAQAPFPIVGDELTSLTGILEYRNGNSKLEPRAAADLVWGAAPLASLGPAGLFTSVGHAPGAIPAPLLASISIPRTFPISVTATAASSSISIDGLASEVLTIPAGQTGVAVPIVGVVRDAAASVQAATNTGGSQAQAVRVLDYDNPADAPALSSVLVPAAAVLGGDSFEIGVSLTIPAAAPTAVALSYSDTSRFASAPPASLVVPKDAISAKVTLTAVGTVTSGAVTISALLDGVTKTSDLTFSNAPPLCSPAQVVISMVYGGGGNSGATLKNDFVELYNRGVTAVNLTGWSVQIASATAAFGGGITPLTGIIPAGGHYLVTQAAGAGGTLALPAADDTGAVAMSASQAKVALVRTTTALSGNCPTRADLVDLFGYGGADCATGSPTPALSNTTLALRKNAGCSTTGSNATDFDVVSADNSTGTQIVPRNKTSPVTATCSICSGP